MSAEPPTVSARHQRVPDFFIVGQPKSGTTELYAILKRHQQIYLPDLKEPLFLAGDLRSRFLPARGGDLPETLENYLSLFAAARPDQRVGEASSSYLWSASAAREIADLQPAARIIAILREPASFLRSLHLQLVQNRVETEQNLRKALSLEDARRRGEHIPRNCQRPPALLYSERVRYVEQLRRFHALFPAEQVLVLVYDDFRADNEGTVRRVLRFLDLDDTAPVEVTEANPTVRVRSQRIDRLVGSVQVGRGPVSRAVKRGITTVAPERLRRRALEVAKYRLVYGKPPPADEGLMNELRRRFSPEVEALGDYLDRDLIGLWGYNRLAEPRRVSPSPKQAASMRDQPGGS
jgi:hypothetical protein